MQEIAFDFLEEGLRHVLADIEERRKVRKNSTFALRLSANVSQDEHGIRIENRQASLIEYYGVAPEEEEVCTSGSMVDQREDE